jgi:hypothetical protein
MKAGTPSGPNQSLASLAGTCDLKIKSWHETGQRLDYGHAVHRGTG